MAVTASNLIMGPATLYIGAFGVSETGLDSGINSTPPASAWTDLGGTLDGAEVVIKQDYTEMAVDQIVDVPGQRLTKRTSTIKTNLAEPTLENLAYALNDGTATSGSSGPGWKAFEPNFASSATQPTYRALLLDGWAPNSLRRRVVLRKVLSVEGVKTAYKKGDQTVLEVTFACHYVSSSIAPFKLIDGLS